MAYEKTERQLTDLNQDELSLLFYQVEKGASQSALAITHGLFKRAQKNRLLDRLPELAQTGRFDLIFKLSKIRPDLCVDVLFTLAGVGEQDKMERILREQPAFLLVSSSLKDISGATFERITLFQHAVWAGDVRYMTNMMIDCIPHNETGEEIRKALLRQFNDLMSAGITYQLNGTTHHENQFNLMPLIQALETHVQTVFDGDLDAIEIHWRTVIGQIQKTLPAHIRHHYCDTEESFYKTPSFNKYRLVRSLQFVDSHLKEDKLWTESLTGLGEQYAISGSGGGGIILDAPSAIGIKGACGRADLRAITILNQVRMEIDLPNLIRCLNSPRITLLVDNTAIHGIV